MVQSNSLFKVIYRYASRQVQFQSWRTKSLVSNLLLRYKSSIYSHTDSTTLTFYYSLINMLQLPKAKHILEVGSGTGRLLPQAMLLKNADATYLATDLSPVMINASQSNIKLYIDKLGVQVSAAEWMKNHKLELKVANGEQFLNLGYKFDRIIASLVIHATPDPVKMLNNLHQMAEEGCLLGVSVWGSPTQNGWFTTLFQALKAREKMPATARTPFHLYNKLQQVGEQSGWEVVQIWEQNAPEPFLKVDEFLKEKAHFEGQGDQDVCDEMCEYASKVLTEKKIINFGCQLAIFRKK